MSNYRVKVLLTTTLGNPREITTLCSTIEEANRRVAMYKERYPDGDVFMEEISEKEA